MVDYASNRYRAVCTRVVDGDTVWLTVDLGLRTKRDLAIRLAGINAPEPKGDTMEAADEATEALARLLFGEASGFTAAPGRLSGYVGRGLPLAVQFEKGKSFDRWVGRLYIGYDANLATDVQEVMVRQGHAVRVDA